MTGTAIESNREVESINIQTPSGNSPHFGFTVWYTNGQFRQTWQPFEWISANYQNWAEQQGVNFNNLPTINWI